MRTWEMDVFGKVGSWWSWWWPHWSWWSSFIVHHHESDAFFQSFSDVSNIQDCNELRSSQCLLFFSEMYKFIDAVCSCSIGFQKVLVLVRFVLPCGHFCNLAWSWSYGLPWGKSHVPKRPPWCRDGTGRVGREFPKAVLSFSYWRFWEFFRYKG